MYYCISLSLRHAALTHTESQKICKEINYPQFDIIAIQPVLNDCVLAFGEQPNPTEYQSTKAATVAACLVTFHAAAAAKCTKQSTNVCIQGQCIHVNVVCSVTDVYTYLV